MKYRLKQDRKCCATYSDDFKEMPTEIEKDVRKMSFLPEQQATHVLALGSWPGIALWKIKVQFTTGEEKDFSYKD
jgi:hypothetical protein